LAAIPSGIAVILILLLIKERKSEGIKIYKGLSLKQLDGNFRLFLVLSAIFALGSFSYSFLLIYAKQFGIQLIFIPVFYLLFTVVAFFFSFPFGKLSDKIGRKPVLMAGFAFWGLLLLTLAFVQSYLAVIFVFVLYGLHRGVMDTVQKTLVADLAPKDFRASTLGGFQMVIGLCALPASLFAGIFWDQINLYIPLYFSLALTAIALVLMVFVKEK
jgi:MFS family permease